MKISNMNNIIISYVCPDFTFFYKEEIDYDYWFVYQIYLSNEKNNVNSFVNI